MRTITPCLFVALLLGCLFGTQCGGDDHCAVAQENCTPTYLKSKGLSGCCSGLTCQDSVVTPGARICR